MIPRWRLIKCLRAQIRCQHPNLENYLTVMTICENCGGTGRVRQFGGRTYECWHCGGDQKWLN